MSTICLPTKTRLLMTEAQLQNSIVKYYHNTYCLKHHSPRCLILSIPNENQHRLLSTGMHPGASDLLIIHNNIYTLFIELKTPTGRIRDSQIKFATHINTITAANPLIQYHIVRSLEEFIGVIANL